jgi:two-component system, NarL family, sensor kinase
MRFGLVLVFLQIITAISAQNIDSIKNIISKTTIDSVKIKAHYQLAKIYTNKQDSTNAVNNFLSGIKLSNSSKSYALLGYGYNEIGYLFELMDEPITASSYYYKAVQNAKEHNLYASAGRAYSNLAFVKKTLSKTQAAIQYFDSSKYFYEKANVPVEVANAMNNKGLVLQSLGKNEEALVNYQKALSIFEQYDANRQKFSPVLNIGKIYLEQKNNDIALEYFLKASTIASKTNTTSQLLLAENNIGVVYYNKKQYPQAIEHFEKAIKLAEKIGDKKQRLESLTNIGSCYDLMGNYEKALITFRTTETELLKTTNYEGLITNYINQAGAAGKQKKYVEALAYCNKAMYYINNHEGNNQYKHYVYETMAAVHKEMGDLKNAFEYQDSQIMAKNEFINKDANDKLLERQTKYETNEKQLKINLLSQSDSIKALRIDNQSILIGKQNLSLANQNLILEKNALQLKDDSLTIINKNKELSYNQLLALQQQQQLQNLNKEQQIAKLEIQQKNNWLISLAIVLFVLAIGGFSFYKYKQQQHKSQLQEKLLVQEKQATINILAAEENERKRIASDLHDGVGQILTATWLNLQQIDAEAQQSNASNKEFISKTLQLMDAGCKEVRAVSHNMMPNALLKKGLVDAVREFIQQINVKQIQVNVQTNGLTKPIPDHTEAVLYRVIQECVNNVVKHAKATRLDISITQEETGEIDVLIEDNGSGFIMKEALKKEGIGLGNIQSRINYLKGAVEWDSVINEGTVVAIHIPC